MRVLVAEDEWSLARAISHIVVKSGYEVVTVYDGEEALAELRRGLFDAAVIDIMMPKADGITVITTMRNEGNFTPVLILSAKSEVDDKVTGLDSGANDYLTKPFAGEELLARLRVLTRAKPEKADARLHMGNIILNRTNYELSSQAVSTTFHLTNKEFLLMETFLMNPKQILSVDTLMEKVWGYESEADISVVWVYISYLRKKLAALKADIQIRATRNAGYSLEEKP